MMILGYVRLRLHIPYSDCQYVRNRAKNKGSSSVTHQQVCLLGSEVAKEVKGHVFLRHLKGGFVPQAV